MKKLLYLCGILLVVLFLELGYWQYTKNTTKKPLIKPNNLKNEVKITKTLFVPYWDLTQGKTYQEYERLMYFGISTNEKGIDENDAGFKNIDNFLSSTSAKINNKYLVLRMLDSDNNLIVLKNNQTQDQLITETVELLREKKFAGLALDLEISGLVNAEVTKQINSFVQKMYTALKNYYIPFSVITYGDTFYRKRPYDIETISKNCDEIMIMAYDFSKPIGEPGPNFPLSKGAKYPYDFKTMINEYLIFVPKNKLTIIYGMYGYEWIVDEKRRPIKRAKALTLKEIKKDFIDECKWQDCVVKRDPYSFEMEVNYIESKIIDTYAAMNMHIIWFEDEESVRMKTEFLKEKGIKSIGYWVAGYF